LTNYVMSPTSSFVPIVVIEQFEKKKKTFGSGTKFSRREQTVRFCTNAEVVWKCAAPLLAYEDT